MGSYINFNLSMQTKSKLILCYRTIVCGKCYFLCYFRYEVHICILLDNIKEDHCND